MNKEYFLYGLDTKIEIIYKYCKIFIELDKNKKRLHKFKELSIYPTFLFYGYPATGKSSVANLIYKKLKEEENIDIYKLNIDELLSSNFGESSHNLRDYFNQIKKDIKTNNSYAFIIMDEIDSFTINRSQNENESVKRVLLTFNTIIDELIQTDEIFKYIIISTTNLKESLDISILRRFYFKEDFNIVLNDKEFKKFIIELYKLIDKEFSDKEYEEIYAIYTNKKYTLGEMKSIFSRYYIDNIIEKDNSSLLIKKVKEYNTFHEIIIKQKG